jgi:hypothetical protein
MILKYRDYKIQEQPAPIEQLTAKPRNMKRYVLIGVVFVIVVSTVLSLLFSVMNREGKGEGEVQKAEVQEEKEAVKLEDIVVFEEEEIIRDFMKGNVIEIPIKDTVHRISIDGVEENLEFSIGSIPFSLATDERVEIDFDRDGRKDVLLRTNRLGEGTVNLTLKKIFKTESSDLSIALESTSQTGSSPASSEGPPEVVIIKEDELFSEIPVAPKSGFQVLSGYEKTDISAAVKAVSTAYLSFAVDESEKKDLLLRTGDTITFNAKDVVRLTGANARGINLELNGVSVTLGRGGETVAKVVRWYRDSDDSDLYHLIIDNWEN